MSGRRRAIVTGSTRGIGRAIAEALVEAGHDIMLNGFGEAEEIEALRRELAERGGGLVAYSPADVTSLPEVEQMFAAADALMGGCDVLVNNAGMTHLGAIETFPVEKWHAILAVNLTGVFYTTRCALPRMKGQNWGRIVNLASTHGLVSSALKVPYIASKHGVVGFTKGTAMEGAAHGITCNAVAPGFVDTPMFELQARQTAENLGLDYAEVVRSQVGSKQAIDRLVSPAEVAALVAFLVSDKAAMITGVALPIDGGWTAQ